MYDGGACLRVKRGRVGETGPTPRMMLEGSTGAVRRSLGCPGGAREEGRTVSREIQDHAPDLHLHQGAPLGILQDRSAEIREVQDRVERRVILGAVNLVPGIGGLVSEQFEFRVSGVGSRDHVGVPGCGVQDVGLRANVESIQTSQDLPRTTPNLMNLARCPCTEDLS